MQTKQSKTQPQAPPSSDSQEALLHQGLHSAVPIAPGPGMRHMKTAPGSPDIIRTVWSTPSYENQNEAPRMFSCSVCLPPDPGGCHVALQGVGWGTLLEILSSSYLSVCGTHPPEWMAGSLTESIQSVFRCSAGVTSALKQGAVAGNATPGGKSGPSDTPPRHTRAAPAHTQPGALPTPSWLL